MGVEGGADSREKNEMPEKNRFFVWRCGFKDKPFCKFFFLPYFQTKNRGLGGVKWPPNPDFFRALALLISISAGS